jgi:UDP-glucose 4-epimerase
MSKKKAIVTGGAGFIGSHLVDRLIAADYEVMIVDNMSTGLRENINPDAKFEEVDIISPEFDRAFAAFKPDLVCHLAAQANVRLSLEDPLFDTKVNAQGTLSVLEACRKNDTGKIIFSSTGGAIYGEPESIPCDESHPCMPLSLYGANKLVAEHYIQVYKASYNLDFTIVRFANVYGPRQNPHGEAGVVAIFSELLLGGKDATIFGDGSKTRDYVHVHDIVDAISRCFEAGEGETFNIGMGVQTSDRQVFDEIAKASGYKKDPIYGDFRAGEVMFIALEAAKIRQALGWQPKFDFASGIADTVPFYKEKLGY